MDLSESLSSYLLNLKNCKFDTVNWSEILSRQRIFHSLQNLDSTIYTFLLWSTALRIKVLATESLISVPLFTLAIYGRSAVWASQAGASHLKWRSVFLTIFFKSVLRGRVQTTSLEDDNIMFSLDPNWTHRLPYQSSTVKLLVPPLYL